jgi:hypothetical protein
MHEREDQFSEKPLHDRSFTNPYADERQREGDASQGDGERFRDLTVVPRAPPLSIINGIVYRPASTLAVLTATLLSAAAAVNAFAALSTVAELPLLDGARFGVPIPREQADAHDTRQRLFAATQLGLRLSALILFLMWVYRFSRNTRALGVGRMAYTPGWAVGWFFVPVASLWMPFRVFNELWQTNQAESNDNWQRTPVSPLLGTWWVISVIVATISYSPWPVLTGARRLADIGVFGRHWANALWGESWGLLAWDVAEIAVNVLTAVVLGMTELQQRKRTIGLRLRETELAAADGT